MMCCFLWYNQASQLHSGFVVIKHTVCSGLFVLSCQHGYQDGKLRAVGAYGCSACVSVLQMGLLSSVLVNVASLAVNRPVMVCQQQV